VGEKCILLNKVCSFAVVLQHKCRRKKAIYGFVTNLTSLQCREKNTVIKFWMPGSVLGKKQNTKMLNVLTQKKLDHFSVDYTILVLHEAWFMLEWKGHWCTDVLMQFMKPSDMTFKLQSNVQ